LAAGGGIGKAWTGGKLPNSCEVSHETAPPLAPNGLLSAGISIVLSFWKMEFYCTILSAKPMLFRMPHSAIPIKKIIIVTIF